MLTKNLKIKGLRKISGISKSLKGGYYDSRYLQVNYNIETNEAWCDELLAYGQSSYILYDDKNIIICTYINKPMTMQEIREEIEDAYEDYMSYLKENKL